jgi:DUF4097 and DUF4098 domain-containing protein YvlB
MNKVLITMALCAAALRAQDGAGKITVPLPDPSRPPRIHAQLTSGGITVRGADVKDIQVETRAGRHDEDDEDESRPARADGMKRLQLPGNAGLEIVASENNVDIKTKSWSTPSNLVITVPRRSSLQLKCMNNGDIVVEGVEGEIEANNLNGRITLRNVSGSVLAHSLNGAVVASLNRVDQTKPMSFSTMNGEIDVTLPADTKANVRMKTDNGEIYSDFDVKIDAQASAQPAESGRQKDGTYRLRFDRSLRGTINGGGPEYQFVSFNGQIYIRKRK